MACKYSTVAIPVEIVQRFREVTDIPLSLFVRATVNNAAKRCSASGSDELLQVFMFGAVDVA